MTIKRVTLKQLEAAHVALEKRISILEDAVDGLIISEELKHYF